MDETQYPSKASVDALPEEVGRPFFSEKVLNSPAVTERRHQHESRVTYATAAAPGFGSVPGRSIEELAVMRDELALHRTLVTKMLDIMIAGQPMTAE